MSYLSLARKYRPISFSQVFGQSSSKRILTNFILMDHGANAIIFSGIRGTGKTSLARLFAKALNCENFHQLKDVCNNCASCQEFNNNSHIDILEFDAASNNGVDFVRDLDILIQQMPTYKKRVLIFDEVHMFSTQAQNAFLKILEEPPKNLIFLLVTTNPEDLEATVRSRCLSMPLSVLSPKEVAENIRFILQSEGRKYSEEFVEQLSMVGGGSLRDVQQILDQVILASGEDCVNIEYLQDCVGLVTISQYKKLAAILNSLNMRSAMEAVQLWYEDGMDIQLLFEEGIPNLLRDFTFYLSGVRDARYLTGLTNDLFSQRLSLNIEQIKNISDIWQSLTTMMKETNHPKLIWEVFFIKICQVK